MSAQLPLENRYNRQSDSSTNEENNRKVKQLFYCLVEANRLVVRS